jgi:Protein of unknown function (DUF2975)
MRAESQAKVNKIKKVSIVFRVICKGLLALVTLLGLGSIVSVTLGVGGVDFQGTVFRTLGLSLSHRLLLGAVTLVTWGIAFKGFYHLHRLFGNYSHGEVFARDSVGQLRKFGVASVLWGVMSFLWLASLAISMHPAKSFRGDADASSIVLGVAIIVIAWFMDMAVDLREENDLTI